ncbi:MAG: polysaccharide biosynthesis C-terminal domain-containing protein, partial [Bacteroidota bacterium]
LIKLSYTLIITPAIIIAVTSLYYSEEFMRLLYPIHEGETSLEFNYRIQESSKVFGLLMASFCAVSTMYIFSTLLTANNNLKHLNLIAFSGVIVNMGLNFVLIPHYQAMGSALATLVTQFLTAGIQVYIVSRIFHFRKNYLYQIKFVFFVAGVFVLGYFSKQTGWAWHVNVALLVLSSLALSMLIRFLSPGNLFKVLKYGEVH